MSPLTPPQHFPWGVAFLCLLPGDSPSWESQTGSPTWRFSVEGLASYHSEIYLGRCETYLWLSCMSCPCHFLSSVPTFLMTNSEPQTWLQALVPSPLRYRELWHQHTLLNIYCGNKSLLPLTGAGLPGLRAGEGSLYANSADCQLLEDSTSAILSALGGRFPPLPPATIHLPSASPSPLASLGPQPAFPWRPIKFYLTHYIPGNALFVLIIVQIQMCCLSQRGWFLGLILKRSVEKMGGTSPGFHILLFVSGSGTSVLMHLGILLSPPLREMTDLEFLMRMGLTIVNKPQT